MSYTYWFTLKIRLSESFWPFIYGLERLEINRVPWAIELQYPPTPENLSVFWQLVMSNFVFCLVNMPVNIHNTVLQIHLSECVCVCVCVCVYTYGPEEPPAPWSCDPGRAAAGPMGHPSACPSQPRDQWAASGVSLAPPSSVIRTAAAHRRTTLKHTDSFHTHNKQTLVVFYI